MRDAKRLIIYLEPAQTDQNPEVAETNVGEYRQSGDFLDRAMNNIDLLFDSSRRHSKAQRVLLVNRALRVGRLSILKRLFGGLFQ